MTESTLLIKSKKRLLKVALTSLLIILVSFLVIAFINQSKANERINVITEQLIGNTYESKYVSDDSNYDTKLTFCENNEVRFERYGILINSEVSKDEIFQYNVSISNLGNATVEIIPTNVDAWELMAIYFDKTGVAQLGNSYVVKNRSVFDPINKHTSVTGIIWIVILIGCIIATTVFVINYLKVLHSIKQNEKDAIKRIEEEKRKAEMAKENERIATIKAFWVEITSTLGFEENEAIYVNSNYMWIANGYLHQSKTFEDYLKLYNRKVDASQIVKKELPYTSIPVDRIQYFAKEGDVQYTTKISGGGGGGYSIAGAIVGGIIAGDTGAVIGSRKKVNDVESEIQTHDNRHTIVRYYNGNSLEVLSFYGFAVYNYLLGKIPEKDLLTIQLKRTTINESNNNIAGVKEKLQTLKELHDDGLINDSDYNEKKNQLLKKL